MKQREGSVIVEFAFAATLLFLLLLGGFEVGRFMLLHQKLSRLAADTSDLISRAEELTAEDVQQVFEAASFILNPFELWCNDGVLIITSVSTIDTQTPRVDWQFDGAGSGAAESSELGVPGQVATLPDGFEMRADENVIFAEVYYNYEPYFGVVTTSTTDLLDRHPPPPLRTPERADSGPVSAAGESSPFGKKRNSGQTYLNRVGPVEPRAWDGCSTLDLQELAVLTLRQLSRDSPSLAKSRIILPERDNEKRESATRPLAKGNRVRLHEQWGQRPHSTIRWRSEEL